MSLRILQAVRRSVFVAALFVGVWLVLPGAVPAVGAPADGGAAVLSCDPGTDPYCHYMPHDPGCSGFTCDSTSQICCLI